MNCIWIQNFVLILFLWSITDITGTLAGRQGKRSLFDDLPFNGALTTTNSKANTTPRENRDGFGIYITFPNFHGNAEQNSEEDNGNNENEQDTSGELEPVIGDHIRTLTSETSSNDEKQVENVKHFETSTERPSSTHFSFEALNISRNNGYSYESSKNQLNSKKEHVSSLNFFQSSQSFAPASTTVPTATAVSRTKGHNVKHQTTISYRTIPVTRQITEFYRVPNIVHHFTTTSSINPVSPITRHEPGSSTDFKYLNPEIPFIIRDHHLRLKEQQHKQKDDTSSNQNRVQGHFTLHGTFGRTQNPSNLPFSNDPAPDADILNLLGIIRRTPRVQPVLTNSNLARIPAAPSSSTIDFSNSEVLKEVIREQRYQLVLNDLRSRLREEKRSTERSKSDYKGLYSKGALLLGAMSLLPTVVNPITAAAGAAATPILPNYLLPLIPSNNFG